MQVLFVKQALKFINPSFYSDRKKRTAPISLSFLNFM